MRQFIISYYSRRADIPRQIVTEGKIGDAVPLGEMLSGVAGTGGGAPSEAGELLGLLSMARQNATEELVHTTDRAKNQIRGLMEVQKALGLSQVPIRIEAYDIANTKTTPWWGCGGLCGRTEKPGRLPDV